MHADANLSRSPAASPFRHEVTGNFGVEAEEKFRTEHVTIEVPGSDGPFDAENPLGKNRSELRVT